MSFLSDSDSQNSLKNRKNWITLGSVVFILLAIPLTVFSLINTRDIRKNAAASPNDPCYVSTCPGVASSQQWALNKINAPAAWDVTHGDTSIKIAVVDTGIRVTPDLMGQVGTGISFAPVGGTTDDSYGSFGSGTNLASIIGATPNNGRDMAGVVWNTTMLPVKSCDFTSGGCSQDQLAQGINWSVTNGAKIIVTGEFFTSSSVNLDAAVANAVNSGVIVIAPAGDNALNNYYPALINGVLSVGATDVTDTIGSFSGHDPTIVAPGAGTTAQPGVTFIATGGCCFVKIGTSKAAAHVAGAAALLLAAGVPYSQVRTALITGAKDLGPAGYDSRYGNGRLDICAALNSAGKVCPVSTTDTDGDTVLDAVDNCPTVSNLDQKNSDTLAFDNGNYFTTKDASVPNGDKTGDACDTDNDNDGLPDASENPLANCGTFNGVTTTHPNPKSGDYTDDDNHNGNAALPMGTDTADNGPSWDTDNDGWPDGIECAQGTNPRDKASAPAKVSAQEGTDTDADGIPDGWEIRWGTCPGPTFTTLAACHVNFNLSNPLVTDTKDSDADTIGDCKEIVDINGDNVANYPGDTIALANITNDTTKARTSDLDFNKDGVLNFPGDAVNSAKRTTGAIPCL
ncbi:MAG TPA: S8 family serine peptidase [Candidatus Saccharimonadales bacterium]|nr:S8 family serine peptidase [Candidatus Saccharimonadales bacterium]